MKLNVRVRNDREKMMYTWKKVEDDEKEKSIGIIDSAQSGGERKRHDDFCGGAGDGHARFDFSGSAGV